MFLNLKSCNRLKKKVFVKMCHWCDNIFLFNIYLLKIMLSLVARSFNSAGMRVPAASTKKQSFCLFAI